MNNDEIKQKKRTYYFTIYNPNWIHQYKELKEIFSPIWQKALSIEHIGSTSIPGMSAKPVIDVLVTVEKMEDFKEEKQQMIDLGFTCLKDYIAQNTLNFYQTGNKGDKINNIHVCELGSQRHQRFIIMRDYFRTHPDKAKEYSNLKQKNRDKYPDDYVSYREAKKNFLDVIEQEAYLWHKSLSIIKLYHGSITPNITKFEPRTPSFPDGMVIPAEERQKGIYLTNSIEMALAMGIRAKGETRVNIENKTIELESPESFNPGEVIYIYEFDIPEMLQANLEYLKDGWQYIVKDINLIPKKITEMKSEDVKKYFKAINF